MCPSPATPFPATDLVRSLVRPSARVMQTLSTAFPSRAHRRASEVTSLLLVERTHPSPSRRAVNHARLTVQDATQSISVSAICCQWERIRDAESTQLFLRISEPSVYTTYTTMQQQLVTRVNGRFRANLAFKAADASDPSTPWNYAVAVWPRPSLCT